MVCVGPSRLAAHIPYNNLSKISTVHKNRTKKYGNAGQLSPNVQSFIRLFLDRDS